MRTKCILFSLVFILVAACKKETTGTQLPTITHSGHDAIGFKINGNIVSIYNSLSSLITLNLDSSGVVTIDAGTSSPDCKIILGFQFNDSIGNYPLQGGYPYLTGFGDNSFGILISGVKSPNGYYISSMYNGSVNVIYYNGTNISGYFQFDAISDSGVVIHITDGIFDLYRN